ncbi:4'-phosphopantetheinyl transferase family protein [Deminuibacter soli]|uniref:Enterobactin synthase component D n=1 Tax=Deminuibacter soli TaxID=2291815 RepID=A0A3E1NLQ0_9BACT|nr:4'-phosphopantetheinyl transferase superfamily protein [Deminuibacter soli]RFM28855.1 4-phosphopantetheinyl transferase [Deminuibacter soli]
MPLFFQQDINENTKLGIWHITEDAAFFEAKVPSHRDITHPHKRLQHLAGRYLLQALFPGFPYHEMLIADSRKPYLPDEQYHFSISHCGSHAAAIVSRTQRVGIDIEMVTPRVYNIRNKFLHSTEWARVQQAAPGQPQQEELLTVLWSAKEAVYKWWSFGSVDFSEAIRLDTFDYAPEGKMNGRFIRDTTYPLSLYWKLFPGMSLVWALEASIVSEERESRIDSRDDLSEF